MICNGDRDRHRSKQYSGNDSPFCRSFGFIVELLKAAKININGNKIYIKESIC